MHKILIIEDDLTIAQTTARHLSKWDFEVKYITDFKDILSSFIAFSPHIVLIDISLPFYNGYHWCSEIRKISKVPILFLSSANDNMSIVMAMNMGADDFIAKPFDLTVLVAKINAIIRRVYSFAGQLNVIEHNGVILNLNDNTVSYQNQTLSLTKNDFRILQVLFENAGTIVSRNSLMLRLWESDQFIDDNTLTVNVTRLRKKLETIKLENLIETKKGIGYLIK